MLLLLLLERNTNIEEKRTEKIATIRCVYLYTIVLHTAVINTIYKYKVRLFYITYTTIIWHQLQFSSMLFSDCFNHMMTWKFWLRQPWTMCNILYDYLKWSEEHTSDLIFFSLSLSFNGKWLYEFVFVCILFYFVFCLLSFYKFDLKQDSKISTKFQHSNWLGSEKLFIRSFHVTFDSIKWANAIIKIHSSNSILFNILGLKS